MSAWIKYYLPALFMIMLAQAANGQQDRKEKLRERQVQLQDEIAFANKILTETRKDEKKSIGELQTLVQKIRIREELIRTIDREMRIVNREIRSQQETIDTLEKTTDRLKGEYADMIRQRYKMRNSRSGLLFVLSSEDFDQAMKRITYLKQYADYRERQVAEIKARQAELEERIGELEARKQDQAKLKDNKQEERQRLVGEKQEQEEVVNDLKDREKEIRKEIKAKQGEANKLEKEIQRIIAEELRRAREKAEREGLENEAKEVGLVSGKDYSSRTNNKRLRALINEKRKSLNPDANLEKTTVPVYNLTPEAQKLAANFAANKGTLPWPVERGIIVSKFGKQPHPVAKGIVVNNPHVEIATEEGAKARASFDGEVTSVIRIPGANKAVLVRHGNYFTVYGNLVEVYVKSGDKVTIKQELGSIYTDKDKRTVLQFGLWLDDKIQNPEPWLVR
jgi:septal ring factor EnvC (AmiA/AmiB activator)